LSVEYHDLKGNQIKNKPTMVNACEWWRTTIALEWWSINNQRDKQQPNAPKGHATTKANEWYTITKMMNNKNIFEQWTMANDLTWQPMSNN
jgi:hypothetical protein